MTRDNAFKLDKFRVSKDTVKNWFTNSAMDPVTNNNNNVVHNDKLYWQGRNKKSLTGQVLIVAFIVISRSIQVLARDSHLSRVVCVNSLVHGRVKAAKR